MRHELICSWLELPAASWPPDHYRLLGLTPGESDVALIEQSVHQRLDTVRRYQMMHPEQATEVMNLLAQAFVCLTEPRAKQAYDEQLLGTPRPASPPPLPAVAQPAPPTVPPPNTPTPRPPTAALPAGPPPLPSAAVTPLPATLETRDPFAWLGNSAATEPGGNPAAAPVAVAARAAAPAPEPEPEPVDPTRAAARSRPARRGLSSRRGLYRRVSATRSLQRLWHRMGKFLKDPQRRFSTHDARELYRLIEQVEIATDDFPLLGDLGMPGHYILNLGQLDRSRDFRNLTEGQRELLKTDWALGLAFLEAHRDFLREEIAFSRRRGRVARLRHQLNSFFLDHPMPATLILGALLALAVALWQSFILGR